jgi:branched-chain amino acid transport system substrate-binding protein
MAMKVRRLTWVGVAVCASLAFTAACSSSGSKGSGGASSPGAASSAQTSGSAATGSPILVGGAVPITSSVYTQPDAQTGLQASIAAVNAAGGVNGHPLKLDFCDTQYTVNGELACARKLVSDKVVAVINPYILADQSGAEFKILADAGIPIFGSQGLSPAELNNADVYPLSSGFPGWSYGAAAQILKAGATKVSILGDQNPASQYGASLVKAALESAGKTATVIVGDPNSDPTFATAAAKATSGGVDGVVLFPGPQSFPKMVSALKAGGFTGKIGTVSAILPAAVITALGAAGDGILVDSQAALPTDTSNPAVATFIADMSKYGGQPTDASLFMWSATQVFAKAIASATTFDAAGVSAAIKSVNKPIDVGTVGPWQATGIPAPLAGFTRILNPTVAYGVVQNGKLTSAGAGFVNPFAELSALK